MPRANLWNSWDFSLANVACSEGNEPPLCCDLDIFSSFHAKWGESLLLSQQIKPGLSVEEMRPLTDVLPPDDLVSSLKVSPDCIKTCSGVQFNPFCPLCRWWVSWWAFRILWPCSHYRSEGLCPTFCLPTITFSLAVLPRLIFALHLSLYPFLNAVVLVGMTSQGLGEQKEWVCTDSSAKNKQTCWIWNILLASSHWIRFPCLS